MELDWDRVKEGAKEESWRWFCDLLREEPQPYQPIPCEYGEMRYVDADAAFIYPDGRVVPVLGVAMRWLHV